MRLFKNFAPCIFYLYVLCSLVMAWMQHIKKFIEEGPIVYIGKVDSLKAYAGRNQSYA